MESKRRTTTTLTTKSISLTFTLNRINNEITKALAEMAIQRKEGNDFGKTHVNSNSPTNTCRNSSSQYNEDSSSSVDSTSLNRASFFSNNQRINSISALSLYYPQFYQLHQDSNYSDSSNKSIDSFYYPSSSGFNRANSNPLPFNCDMNCKALSSLNEPFSANDNFINKGSLKPKPITLKHQTKRLKKKSSDIPKNKIHLEDILRQKDKRTTLMIRNIPNKFVLSLFLEEMNREFRNKYDVVYLPSDKGNKCNLGYGFINFIDSMTIIAFYNLYFGQKWSKFNSDKRCELVYSKIQGRTELMKYIERSNEVENDNVYVDYKCVKTDIVLPLRYLQAFLVFYPYASYEVIGIDKFIAYSFFNF